MIILDVLNNKTLKLIGYNVSNKANMSTQMKLFPYSILLHSQQVNCVFSTFISEVELTLL